MPPVRAAAIDQLFEFGARYDALIGGAPSLVVRDGYVACIRRLCASNLD
jgi:hypothetical protein